MTMIPDLRPQACAEGVTGFTLLLFLLLSLLLLVFLVFTGSIIISISSIY